MASRQTFSTWTETVVLPWVGDYLTREHLVPVGARLDPTQFLKTDASVVTTTAVANPGATSIAVSALTNPIPSGTILDFGSRPSQTVTVTASASGGATSITVAALTAALPSGTLLDFGTNKFARLTAAAAAGATSLTVAAIPTALAGSETATVPASSIVAKTTANAAAGATSITVEALPEAILSGDSATYLGSPLTKATVPSGTLIGRTVAERDAGTGFGPASASDDFIFLVAFDVTDVAVNPDVDLYRHGSVVKENFLPAVSRNGTNLPLVRARYACITGAN